MTMRAAAHPDPDLATAAMPARRAALAWLLAGLLPVAGPSAAHDGLGPVDPRLPAPPLPLTLHDGRETTLPALLAGRWTALQLMFTGCSAVCPIQGAVFAALQGMVVGTLPNAQLLSVSIDPLADDPRALAAWRAKFGAAAPWLAARPPLAHARALGDFVGSRASGTDAHTAQVYLFDARGRLAYRMAEFAGARDIARYMRDMARAR